MVLNNFVKAACLSTCLGLASGSILANANYHVETNGGLKVYDGSHNNHWFKLSGKIKFDQTYFQNHKENFHVNSSANLKGVDVKLSGGLGRDLSYNVDLSTNDEGNVSLSKAAVHYMLNGAKLSFGQVSNPYGLENASNSSFLERSLATSVFSPSSGLGMSMDYAWTDKVGVRLALTHPTSALEDKNNKNKGQNSLEQVSASFRVSCAAVQSENLVLHLGLSGRYHTAQYNENKENGSFKQRFNSNVEARGRGVESKPVDTNDLDLLSMNVLGLDAALQRGPLFLQAEYHRANLQQEGMKKDVNLYGYNIQATYSLTGENRTYNSQTGGFSGVTPSNDNGAWELSVRHSFVNLDRGNVDGGTARTWGAGVAWTANDNLKVLANYVLTPISDVKQDNKPQTANVNALALRVQAAW